MAIITKPSSTPLPPGARSVPPRASAMIEALRGLGYSAATALSDIIDNSISANAQSVDLNLSGTATTATWQFWMTGPVWMATSSSPPCVLAKRSPLDPRAESDLGRFGMGLKTASFSQCRRLTVASIKDGCMNCLRWDLDFIASKTDDGWLLLEGPASESEGLFEPLHRAGRGTMVLWELLDRIVGPGIGVQDFLNLTDSVERHLSMVFHRYLEGALPDLRLSINGRAVPPWDPFSQGSPRDMVVCGGKNTNLFRRGRSPVPCPSTQGPPGNRH